MKLKSQTIIIIVLAIIGGIVAGCSAPVEAQLVTNTPSDAVRVTPTKRPTVAPMRLVTNTPLGFVASATVSPTSTATETPTVTPSLTATASPTITASPTSTTAPTAVGSNDTVYSRIGANVYVLNQANVRSLPNTTADILIQLGAGQTLPSDAIVKGETFKNSDRWYRVSYNNRVGYMHESVVSTSPVVVAPAVVAPASGSGGAVVSQPAANVSQPSFVCPSNCDGAVAMGLTAQQAATCPRLDRDKDGVACYGD